MEADGAYSSDVCIILDIPAEGVECEFDILLEPMGIDASEYTVICACICTVCIYIKLRKVSIVMYV